MFIAILFYRQVKVLQSERQAQMLPSQLVVVLVSSRFLHPRVCPPQLPYHHNHPLLLLLLRLVAVTYSANFVYMELAESWSIRVGGQLV